MVFSPTDALVANQHFRAEPGLILDPNAVPVAPVHADGSA